MTEKQIESLGTRMLRQHGLSGWHFWVTIYASDEFNGKCCYGSKRIILPAQMVKRSRYAIRQVILHEIAHALVGLKAAHGPRWQKKARELGVREREIRQCLHFYRAEWPDLGVWPWQGVLAFGRRGEPPITSNAENLRRPFKDCIMS